MTEARILIIDDDAELSAMIEEYLQNKGYAVETHGSAQSAWDSLLKGAFELILLDLDLPDANGIDFCRLYRDSGGLAPILMLTGRTDLEDKEEGLESGADDYITKPVSLRELHARIKSMLRRNSSYLPPETKGFPEAQCGLVLDEKYRLEKEIGSGGMAIIWLATDLNIQRQVVIKLMHGYLAGKDDTPKRFLQESRMLAKVQHPNVVSIYDSGFLHNKIPYLVMEYVNGDSLRNALESRSKFSIRDSIQTLLQICGGLQKVHEAGIIHRDLKPENILLQKKRDLYSSVKIADFGIARLVNSENRITKEGIVVGTIDYMSPEQLQDRRMEASSDIYSLGIILYELLTGKLPFDVTTTEAKAAFHIVERPDAPSTYCPEISVPLDEIVLKCLQKKAERRFQSASELAVALNLLELTN